MHIEDEVAPEVLCQMGLLARIATKPRKKPLEEARRLEAIAQARLILRQRNQEIRRTADSFPEKERAMLNAHFQARFGRPLEDDWTMGCNKTTAMWAEEQRQMIMGWENDARREMLLRGTLIELLKDEPSPNKRRWLRIKIATPKWVDFDEIALIYMERDRISAETGVRHEVDHIIPLAGKNVCGLHVHFNLRVIPALENRRKGARFEEIS